MFHHAPAVSCVDGIDLFSPKFNVVPPGENIFPLQHTEDRVKSDRDRVYDLLLSRKTPHSGYLDNPSKQPIFSSLPSLDQEPLWSAECLKVRHCKSVATYLIVTGKLHPDEATNL